MCDLYACLDVPNVSSTMMVGASVSLIGWEWSRDLDTGLWMVVMEEGFMSTFAGVILPSSQQGRIFSNQIKIDDKIII